MCIYIVYCLDCQLNQIKRHSIYDEFISIIIFAISFHTIIINFIIVLSEIKNGYNIFLIVICKFIKRVLLIFEKNTWNVAQWTKIFIKTLIEHDWNIFKFIINNRNSKFMSKFWNAIFNKMNVSMLTSTVYHLQTNNQFERINQIIEITFRFHITICLEDDWNEILFFLQVEFNNVKQFVIDYASNELTYKFKINDVVGLLADLISQNYN